MIVDGREPPPPKPPQPLAKKKGGLAVASALLVSLLVLAQLVSWPIDGSLVATRHTTLAIDDRLGLVVSAGTQVTWSRDVRGNFTVSLERGRAFVRLSRGLLALTTPAVSLRSTMGAFSVETSATETVIVVHEGRATVAPLAADATKPAAEHTAGTTLRAGADGSLNVSLPD